MGVKKNALLFSAFIIFLLSVMLFKREKSTLSWIRIDADKIRYSLLELKDGYIIAMPNENEVQTLSIRPKSKSYAMSMSTDSEIAQIVDERGQSITVEFSTNGIFKSYQIDIMNADKTCMLSYRDRDFDAQFDGRVGQNNRKYVLFSNKWIKIDK